MSIKMKGLLKGLRYISQIFDQKEQEMQIGYPTDVKHVAHIGWDGPSVNPPSWMNEFRSAPLSTVRGEAMTDESPARYPSQDLNVCNGGLHGSPLRELPDQLVSKQRRQASAGSAEESPQRSPAVPKHSRRNKSATALPVDMPARESTTSKRQGANSANGTPADGPALDIPSIPKVARKKKSKTGTASAGSTRSTRSKAQASSKDPAEYLPVMVSTIIPG
ncbi:CRIB domain-containing protein RIC6-like [Wolffia australiana]